MSNPVLNFNSATQEFSFNQEVIEGLDFRSMALDQLFDKDISSLIVKNFIDKDVALKIRDYYSKTRNKESFVQGTNESNHRIFYYQNSPYRYPQFIISLLEHCMIFKNKIYFYHDYYQIYCMLKDVEPRDFKEVARIQSLHTWASIYWYKNGNSHYRHLDNFGELAAFVIFSKKGEDYEQGGLVVEQGEKLVSMDESYDYGDLVLFDQSQVFHEVLPIQTVGNQIGRMHLYVPTIPPNYMQKILMYEGHPLQAFFTNENYSFGKKMKLWAQHVLEQNKIHYSRQMFNHYQKEI